MELGRAVSAVTIGISLVGCSGAEISPEKIEQVRREMDSIEYFRQKFGGSLDTYTSIEFACVKEHQKKNLNGKDYYRMKAELEACKEFYRSKIKEIDVIQ